ncbi:MAG: GAF domain-containing sensor histidine kinase [Ferrovibrio sp.]|uniref:GAF domain-containing sensor histidine kinase n=1 Tax=Ferrovibrio sp. TaxID=1917215 RepID=UPI002603CD84|nr:GAF domain-containing sensor histidine kinase [Ferrovibrio sp.]MCW0233815.1 GAF domain-containing sensor histidine kinase [Ferrovibrio sp.]
MTVPAALPAHENQRLAALRDYSILDTAADERFDRITELAADLFDVPIALVTLVDSERQWFKSSHGLPVRETPRDIAFCAHAILDDAPFVVENALDHPLFRKNPLVCNAPHIRFYAGIPLTDHDGHRLGSLCILDHRSRRISADDVLRLRRLAAITVDELELHKAQIQAERLATAQVAANQLKRKFLSSMSHEFRTPLNAILGFSQILEMNPGGKFTRDDLGYVDAIKTAGQTLLHLTDGMLTMAQLEAGAVPFDIEPVQAQDVISEAFQLHLPAARLNQVTLTRQLCEQPLTLRADYTQLLRIVGNFISNAFKFTAAGGRITLGCACDANRQVTLYVQDTGCGIPAERQHDAFQSFNRLGREGSAVAGLGLGLAIARRLTHAMNGEIGFESEEQVGSRFWIRLPAA